MGENKEIKLQNQFIWEMIWIIKLGCIGNLDANKS